MHKQILRLNEQLVAELRRIWHTGGEANRPYAIAAIERRLAERYGCDIEHADRVLVVGNASAHKFDEQAPAELRFYGSGVVLYHFLAQPTELRALCTGLVMRGGGQFAYSVKGFGTREGFRATTRFRVCRDGTGIVAWSHATSSADLLYVDNARWSFMSGLLDEALATQVRLA